MEKVWKEAPFTLHVTAGGVFHVMRQHAHVHTQLLLDCMQERPEQENGGWAVLTAVHTRIHLQELEKVFLC